MATLRIPIILGTGRENRQSQHVAQAVLAYAQTRKDIEVELIDVRDYPIDVTSNKGETAEEKKWKPLAEAADAFIIVTPEYNHSFPGELKLFMDMAYDEYSRKAVGFVPVSAGGLGGARVAEHLLAIMNTYDMAVSKRHAYVSKVKDLFDDSGQIVADQKKGFEERLTTLFDDVVWYAAALKEARKA